MPSLGYGTNHHFSTNKYCQEFNLMQVHFNPKDNELDFDT